MTDEAERASRTIDDLMELSRIELGGERTVGPVRIADVLRTALDRVSELKAGIARKESAKGAAPAAEAPAEATPEASAPAEATPEAPARAAESAARTDVAPSPVPAGESETEPPRAGDDPA